MKRHRTAMLLSSTLLLIIAGCPINTSSPGGGTGTDPLGSVGAGGSGGSGGVAGAATDSLTDEFPTCFEDPNGDAWRDEVLRLVNVERGNAGLNPVVHNQTLENQATKYACEMIQYNFFAHENPVTGTDLRARAAEFGYEFQVIGENLAAGQKSPAQAMADWMASPGHRANILNPDFIELGVGVRTGGTYGTYWVQEFGKPLHP